MKTVRRYLYSQIISAVVFVAVAFLSLFFFIDFVDELQNVGRHGYTLRAAALGCLYSVPGHLYELFPIALLIGAIYTMSRLAQSSEFVILRTAGLGPDRALRLLFILGLACGVLTFALGDWVIPWSEQQAALISSHEPNGQRVGASGAWVRDTQTGAAGTHEYAVNIAQMQSDGQFLGIRIYEFSPTGQLVSRTLAGSGGIDDKGVWTLKDVDRMQWPDLGHDAHNGAPYQTRVADPQMQTIHHDTYVWASGLSQRVVSSAVLPLQTMSTVSLYTYMRHLSSHEQTGQRYEIQFWKKALYPLTCLVMITLALPFAYLQARDTGVSLKVFGGILLGIAFVLLNNVTNHLGLLQNWRPWVAAITPSAVYLLLSLAAFNWLVRHR